VILVTSGQDTEEKKRINPRTAADIQFISFLLLRKDHQNVSLLAAGTVRVAAS